VHTSAEQLGRRLRDLRRHPSRPRQHRELRPRNARATFVPLRDESLMRGLTLGERIVLV
jgi:hypothetical protein